MKKVENHCFTSSFVAEKATTTHICTGANTTINPALLPGVICYFDNVFVSGKTQSEHDSNLRAVLRRLSNYGIKLNTKCVFGVPRIEVVGQIVGKNGAQPNPNLVNGIADAATQSSPEQVRSLLGTR